eukprot:m.20663 g.20663  ORF g.20663 m.20663 type:complete len:367 (+) comp6917_c0_seq1:138-1238(+)
MSSEEEEVDVDDTNEPEDQDGGDVDESNEPEDPEEDDNEDDKDEDEKEEEEEEEKDPPPPERSADKELIAAGLSTVGTTMDGSSFVLVSLDLKSRELTDINALSEYKYLRYVDLSKNMLQDLSPLESMNDLCVLNVNENKLQSLGLQSKKYLQHLFCAENGMTTLWEEGTEFQNLEKLDISGNKIQNMEQYISPQTTPELIALMATNNELSCTPEFRLPNLTKLTLDGNNITTTQGLGELLCLEEVYFRDNQITSLDGFNERQTQLQRIDCSNNKISTITEIAKLGVLPNLKELTLAENVVADESDYRSESLILNKALEILDDEPYEEDERAEAARQRKERAEAKKAEDKKEDETENDVEEAAAES